MLVHDDLFAVDEKLVGVGHATTLAPREETSARISAARTPPAGVAGPLEYARYESRAGALAADARIHRSTHQHSLTWR
jgi:hypothetical protein